MTFLVSFGVYTLDKAVDADKDTINIPERSKFLRGKKNLVIGCSLGAYVISMVMAFMDKPLALIIVLFPVIINVAYGTKLPGIPRIKDIPVMKNLVVAMCWALCATMLPAIHLSNPYGFTTDLVMYFMLVKSFLNTILYDVRDIKGDKESSVRTVPILLGPKKTLITLLAINSTLWPWLFFIDRSLRCFSTILIVYGYAYIHYFRERRNPYALDLFVDGEWMLATALLGVLSIA